MNVFTKTSLGSLLIPFFLFVSTTQLKAQASACPAVNAGTDQNICSGQCVNLTAAVQGTVGTTAYTVSSIPYNPYPYSGGNSVLINIDDTWSPVINMPFCFEFFGNTYNQIVIGSNALVTFDLSVANGYCQWPINAAIPSNADPMNSIMAPWHDIDPSVGTPSSATDVNWQVFGVAPCREFCISWNDVAMFSCTSIIATSQVILHESTNIIDMYIQNKPVCSTWNGGAAIEGIQNSTGTIAYTVAGRNFPTQWTATNDGQRFMPAGAPNYTISWTDPNGVIGTTNTINVCPTVTTTYTATVTNSSCSGPIVVSDQITINVTNSLSATSSSTPSNCTSNNGTATVSPSGGSGSYTYSWSPSGGSAATASNLSAGTYTCVITDANTGCSTTVTVVVSNTGNMTATNTSTNITCNGGNNGSATVTPSGGSGIYTYSWAPSGGSAATASGLAAGTYTCTITDSNGCTTTQVVTITQPSAITTTTLQTDIACNGNNTGSATVNPSGGSGIYTYSWAPAGGTGSTASNLTAGNYTCTITDANGCTATASFSIIEPSALSTTISVVNAGCSSPGSATANPSGGTSPYTYSWSSGGTAQTENNLVAGNYTVTITDANGCITTQTCTIGSSSNVTSVNTSSNISCAGGSNGSATVNPSGGSGVYTYNWTPSGGTSATASGLSAGTYTCVITDSNGCTSTQTFTITAPSAITSVPASTNVSCNGSTDGSASVSSVSGGTPAYTYNWAPSGGTSATAGSLAAGTYTVTITDANGCTSTQSFTITQPSALNLSSNGSAVCAGSPSIISTTVTGGTAPYTYAWSNGGTTASQTVTITTTTVYNVTVTDANGCTNTATVTATINPSPVATITSNAVNGVFQVSATNSQLCFNGPNGMTGYLWDLNGTSTSTQQSPCVPLTTANLGTYCATLIVTNNFGCLDTANACVEISNWSYSIPNVFTPNADGNNDAFVITNTGMKELKCEIYNRWGELIYEWDGATGSWNGQTKNGKDASDGVYYYTAHLVNYSDQVFDESGFVQLIKGN